jgi:hypothetical protein
VLYQELEIDADDSVISKSPDGFGYGTKKLRHAMIGTLRGLQHKKILARVDHELPKGDQRRLSLVANDPGNCTLPASINVALRFSPDEFQTFQTSLGRKLAMHLPCLAEHIGAPIASNGKSRKPAVDLF